MSRKSKQRVQPSGDRAATREEREARKAAKAEESIRRRKRVALGRRLRTAGIAIAVIAVVVAAYMFLPRSASYSIGGDGQIIQGVQLYSNSTGHVSGSVNYPQTPPAGGQHNSTWLNCGLYNEPVPSEFAVHSLEHGAVWVTYDPALADSELEALRMHLPSSYVILSPYAGLPGQIVLSAWNVQLAVESAGDERIPLFFEEYWRSQYVPEPGALCSGGMRASGRVS